MTISRFNSLNLSENISLSNRLVLPPMASGTSDTQGFVTEKSINHYKNLAQSGASLMFAEYTYVNEYGRSEPNQLGAQSDAHIEGLSKIAQIFKEAGAIAGLQLTYCGGKGSLELAGGTLWGPSQGEVPARDRSLPEMNELPTEKVPDLIQDFINAADRAQKAGFDMVELHCAHGYGINQWLSPLTNKRQDEYGGSLENNFKMLKDIILGIRKNNPNLLIATRIPGQDHFPEGLSIEDMQWIAKQLELLGVSLIDVSSGIGGWKRPKERRGQGYLVEDAAKIKQAINIPVIGVGGIETNSYIETALQESWLDLAAVGRAILKGPLDWKKSFTSGNKQ